jgi:predicted nucleotide-binding protein
MLDELSFAILVLTGEDRAEDRILRARQNVIHEAGLFQDQLGFIRAIILLKEGTENYSNIQVNHQIRYSKDNIKETFGEVIATLNRELR